MSLTPWLAKFSVKLFECTEHPEALVKTHRQFYEIHNDRLYVHNVEDCGSLGLLRAAKHGVTKAVQRFLESGADAETEDALGRTSISCAAKNGHEAVVQLLVKHNRSILNTKDKTGRTPLSWAAENGQEQVVRLLIGYDRADLNCKDRFAMAPLHWAAYGGHEAVVELLMKYDGSILNSGDRFGWTPLLWAAKRGHWKVVIRC